MTGFYYLVFFALNSVMFLSHYVMSSPPSRTLTSNTIQLERPSTLRKTAPTVHLQLQRQDETEPIDYKSPVEMKFLQLYYKKVYGPWLWVRFLDVGSLFSMCMNFATRYQSDPICEINAEKHFKDTFYWKDGTKIVLDAIRCDYLREPEKSKPVWVSYYLAESDKPNDAFVFDENENYFIEIKDEFKGLRTFLH